MGSGFSLWVWFGYGFFRSLNFQGFQGILDILKKYVIFIVEKNQEGGWSHG
jgi:nucleoside recognition membrane protein YjiH